MPAQRFFHLEPYHSSKVGTCGSLCCHMDQYGLQITYRSLPVEIKEPNLMLQHVDGIILWYGLGFVVHFSSNSSYYELRRHGRAQYSPIPPGDLSHRRFQTPVAPAKSTQITKWLTHQKSLVITRWLTYQAYLIITRWLLHPTRY